MRMRENSEKRGRGNPKEKREGITSGPHMRGIFGLKVGLLFHHMFA